MRGHRRLVTRRRDPILRLSRAERQLAPAEDPIASRQRELDRLLQFATAIEKQSDSLERKLPISSISQVTGVGDYGEIQRYLGLPSGQFTVTGSEAQRVAEAQARRLQLEINQLRARQNAPVYGPPSELASPEEIAPSDLFPTIGGSVYERQSQSYLQSLAEADERMRNLQETAYGVGASLASAFTNAASGATSLRGALAGLLQSLTQIGASQFIRQFGNQFASAFGATQAQGASSTGAASSIGATDPYGP